MPIIVPEVLGIKLKTPYMLGKHPSIEIKTLCRSCILSCVCRGRRQLQVSLLEITSTVFSEAVSH